MGGGGRRRARGKGGRRTDGWRTEDGRSEGREDGRTEGWRVEGRFEVDVATPDLAGQPLVGVLGVEGHARAGQGEGPIVVEPAY